MFFRRTGKRGSGMRAESERTPTKSPERTAIEKGVWPVGSGRRTGQSWGCSQMGRQRRTAGEEGEEGRVGARPPFFAEAAPRPPKTGRTRKAASDPPKRPRRGGRPDRLPPSSRNG